MTHFTTLLLLPLALCLLYQISPTDGSGRLTIRFHRYENPGGKGANGHCCDGKWGICQSNGCDHKFTICIDTMSSSDDVSVHSCAYGRRQSGEVRNANTIDFNTMFGGVVNPIDYAVNSIPETFSLKVKVYDDDSSGIGSDDYVDFLRQDVPFSDFYWPPGEWREYSLSSRTHLDVEITYTCDDEWYTQYCNVFCANPGVGEHYTCDALTGERGCEEGWIGDNCDEPSVYPCESVECQNGGTCHLDQAVTAQCACRPDFTGEFCERLVCSEYCAPGECVWTSDQGPSQYRCDCPSTHVQEAIADDTSGFPFRCMEIPPTPYPPAPEPTTTTTEPPTTVEATTTTAPVTLPSYEDRTNADCDTLAQNGNRYMDGAYEIEPVGGSATMVYCDMSAVGWTVIQRRAGDNVDFNRDWSEYVSGFGTPSALGSYWLGLDTLHHLSTQRSYKLQIQMQLGDHTFRYANYGSFDIGGADTNYTLNLDHFDGSAGDAIQFTGMGNKRNHNGMPFSTRDRDHDNWDAGNCAHRYQSGWWFNDCFWCNLNGAYVEEPETGWPQCHGGRCISWLSMDDYQEYSLIGVEMKILPVESGRR